MNITLLWLLMLPLALSTLTFFLLPKLSLGKGINHQRSALFAGIGLVISIAIMTLFFMLGKSSQTQDVEVWNGQITAKDRKHDHYLRSYQCNCRSVTSGTGNNRTTTTQCDTCYEDRWTVTWTASSTIGSFRIDHLDRGSKSVWNSPDPDFYVSIQPGDPCSRLNSYTNYIKAVPESLFRPTSQELKAKFANQIPAYPANIYNYYQIDRVIPVGVSIPNLKEWNKEISLALRTLGPQLQTNFVVVIANTEDADYFYALQDAWVGAKKNDIVVVIGAPNFPAKPSWVRVMALTDKEIFKVQLRDAIMDLETLTVKSVVDTVSEQTRISYQRKRMRDFEYLDSEIDPPTWLIITMIIVLMAAYVGFWAYVYAESKQWIKIRRQYRF